MRSSLCHRVLEQVLIPNLPVAAAATDLIHNLLRYEGHFSIPEIDTRQALPRTKIWELRALAKRRLAVLEHPEAQQRIEAVLVQLLHTSLPDRLPASQE